MIYIIVLIFLTIPVIIFDLNQSKKHRRFWYYSELIVLILLAGLRYRVGGDTLMYISKFETYPTLSNFNLSFKAEFNPLWYFYNALIKSLIDDFTFFQLIQATIVNSIFFNFFKKYSTHFFSAILIYYVAYYLYFNMEILREILSICVLLLSFDFLIKRNYFKYFICCCIALLFHFSAVIMLFIPFFIRLPKINWKFTVIIFVVLIFTLSFINIAPMLSSLLIGNELLMNKFIGYSKLQTLNIRGIIVYLFPIVVLMYANRKSRLPANDKIFHNILFLYVILIGLTVFLPVIFSRMRNYLAPFYILYLVNTTIPIIINSSYRSTLKSYISKIVLIWILFFSFRSYTTNLSQYMKGARSYNIYYPYHSIFNPVTETKRERFIEIYKSDYKINNE